MKFCQRRPLNFGTVELQWSWIRFQDPTSESIFFPCLVTVMLQCITFPSCNEGSSQNQESRFRRSPSSSTYLQLSWHFYSWFEHHSKLLGTTQRFVMFLINTVVVLCCLSVATSFSLQSIRETRNYRSGVSSLKVYTTDCAIRDISDFSS